MEKTLKSFKEDLTTQLEQTAAEIREHEQKLMQAKERFLKIAGALEYHAVLEQKQEEQEASELNLIE